MEKLKVFIADDDLKYIDDVRAIFCHDEDFEIIGLTQDGKEAYSKIKELQPDLVFIGSNLKNMKAEDIIEKINPFILDAKVFFVLMTDKKIVFQRGFLSKYNTIDILYKPIEDYELKNIQSSFAEKRKKVLDRNNNEKFRSTQMRFRDFEYTRIIDYSKYYTSQDIELLKKLNIEIDINKLYTESEHDQFLLVFAAYWDGAEDIHGNPMPPIKILDFTGVSKQDFDRLHEIMLDIETIYT